MTALDLENDRLLRLSEVMQKTGLSESTIYRRMKEGSFPQSVSLGPACVRWLLSEVQEWIEDRLKARVPVSDLVARSVNSARDR